MAVSLKDHTGDIVIFLFHSRLLHHHKIDRMLIGTYGTKYYSACFILIIHYNNHNDLSLRKCGSIMSTTYIKKFHIVRNSVIHTYIHTVLLNLTLYN